MSKFDRPVQREVPKNIDFLYDRETSMTDGEKQQIEKLKEAGVVEKIKELGWITDDVARQAEHIVSFRSEDILYLLECVKKGFIPTERFHLTHKVDSTEFFTSPNYASPDLLEQALGWDIPEGARGVSFQQLALRNIDGYGVIAKKQAVLRNIVPLFGGWDNFSQYMRAKRHGSPEDFIDYIIDEHRLLGKVVAPPEIIEYLGQRGMSRQSTKNFFADVGNKRGSVLVVFGKKLLEERTVDRKYFESEDPSWDSGNLDSHELVVRFPDKKVPLESIIGFEALGEFEDAVLERLGLF